MKQFGPSLILMLTAFGGPAFGQAMVGYGLGAANAATSTAPMAGIGKAVGKALGNLDKTVKSEPAASSKSAVSATQAKSKPASIVHYEDPAKIETGIAYSDLVRRFGRPSIEITGDDGNRTLTYLSKTATAELLLKGEKVDSVDIRRQLTEPRP